MSDAANRMFLAINKLTKWRTVFAGWQLGTRSKDDPEAQAVRDHRELSMVLRAESTAIMSLLIRKGIVTNEEYFEAVADEAALLDADYEAKFPGYKTTQTGLSIDPRVAAQTTKHWRQ